MSMKCCARSTAFALVASAIIACGGSAKHPSDASDAEQNHGYGFEMVPLTLSPGPAPKGDALMPRGQVSPDEIQRQAFAKVPEIQKCVDASKARGANADAMVVVKLKFEESGALASSNVEAPRPSDAELGNCVVSALDTIKLPATKSGPLTVVYPVSLH